MADSRRGYVGADGSVVRPKSAPAQKAPPPQNTRIRGQMGAGASPVYQRGANGQIGYTAPTKAPRPRPIPVGAKPPQVPPRSSQQRNQPRPQAQPQQRPQQQRMAQQQRPPQQRPNGRPAQNVQHNRQTQRQESNFVQKQAPKRQPQPPRRQNDGWIVPEGSTVYTAQGQYRPRQAPQNNRQRPPQNRTPQRPPQPPRQKKKGDGGKKVLWALKVFFVRFIIMLLIVSGAVFWWYRAQFCTSEGGGGEITYVMDSTGYSSGKDSFTASPSQAYYSGVRYIDLTVCADWFNMTEVGSVGSMRYIISDPDNRTSAGSGQEEYVIFTNNHSGASVNGTTVIMNAPCRSIGSHIWVPLSFVENYIEGVTVENSGTDTVTIVSDFAALVKEGKEKLGKEDKAPEVAVSFKLKRSVPLTMPAPPQ